LSGFRLTDPGAAAVAVTLDGNPTTVAAGRSLLASLLALDVAVEFLCAIGQCQRCLVLIDGARRPACLHYPQEGEAIVTTQGSARA
jgi:aerobic-type carbon monoxide dehydrogenase small subunit (CoxS/CutS family)